MKNNTLIALLFVLAAIASACGATAPEAPSSASDAPQASAYERIVDTGTARIGVRFDNPPLSFIDDQGDWVGFDVDLARALADQLGVELEMVRVDETTRISFLQDGKIDIAVASMNHTRQRDAAIDFSITYFWDNQSFLVRRGTHASLDDLFGLKVAANAGSSAIPAWQAYVSQNGGPEPEIVEFTDKLTAMQALRDGVVEGYTEDNITLLALAAGDPDLVLVPGGFNPVQFGIGVPVNDSRLRDEVNYALQDLWKDGTYATIYEKWFEGPEALIPLPLGGQMEIWPD